MAVGVQKAWSATATDNQTADSNINLTEGGGTYKAPHVNNTQRAMMAAAKGFANQITGYANSAGSSNAYTYASDAVAAISTSYARGMSVVFKANHSNSGASTLNVDGVGATAIRKGGAESALITGDIVANGIYRCTYNGTYWILENPDPASFAVADATTAAFAALATADNSMLDFTGTDTMAAVSYATVVTNLAVAGLALANTFTAAQTINLNAAALPSPSAGTSLHIGQANDTSNRVTLDGFGNSNGLVTFRRARTSAAAPSALQASDSLGGFQFWGYGASAYSSNARVSFVAVAKEPWTATEQGAFAQFFATPVGGTSVAEKYRMGDLSSALEVGKACSVPTSRTADWTMAATDESGATDYHTSGSTHTFTIPANASVALPVGFVRIIDNTGNSGAAGAVTVAITSDTLRRGDGVSGTGSRTVPAGGVACIRKVSSTEWIITGAFT